MTEKYPSQQNRKPVLIDAGLHQDMKEWCKKKNISMKFVFEELAQMCLEDKIEITVSVRRSDD